MPLGFDRADQCVDEILRRAGKTLVVALPIGLGKPVPLVNELYRRAVADPTLALTLLTGLTLALPRAAGDLERRFLEPFVARVFGDCPEPDYLEALRRDALPANVRIIEFFFTPGLALDWPQSQQDYLAANYTQVTRDVLDRGVNVVLQLIATRSGKASCNTASAPIRTSPSSCCPGCASAARPASSWAKCTRNCRSCWVMRWSPPLPSICCWNIRATTTSCIAHPTCPSIRWITPSGCGAADC